MLLSSVFCIYDIRLSLQCFLKSLYKTKVRNLANSCHGTVHVNDMAFVYKTMVCHSYNTLDIQREVSKPGNTKHRENIKVNVATIDTMLSFYLAFWSICSTSAVIWRNRMFFIACWNEFLTPRNRVEDPIFPSDYKSLSLLSGVVRQKLRWTKIYWYLRTNLKVSKRMSIIGNPIQVLIEIECMFKATMLFTLFGMPCSFVINSWQVL